MFVVINGLQKKCSSLIHEAKTKVKVWEKKENSFAFESNKLAKNCQKGTFDIEWHLFLFINI